MIRSCMWVLFISFLPLSCASPNWISLFDGKTLQGWEPSENKETWKVEDGALVSKGPRSHLFYTGGVNNHNFKNFEFMAEVKTTPGSNSDIYFHIVVQGKTIRTYINGELMVDYTEPDNPFRPEDKKGRLLSSGTFALQGHDPKSVVYYKNINGL